MRKLTLALSTAALALSGAALAQTAQVPARSPKPDMTRADAQARAEAMFARMDADKDGSLSRAEIDAMHAAGGGAMKHGGEGGAMKHGGEGGDHGKMDHGMGAKGPGGGHGMMGAGSGPVTRQAFIERALAKFDRADANRDGIVTQAERKAARETMRQHSPAKRPQG